MSNPNRQQHKEIFAQALELPPTEQQQFLQTACGDKTELLEELSSLLEAHNGSNEFLESDVIGSLLNGPEIQGGDSARLDSDQVVAPPQFIGSCRIVKEIGSGGMGIVYEGVDEKLGRPVAVKTVRADRASEENFARFEREARECAKIDHENVIRIFEVGRTEDGAPFIVMELLKGTTLDVLIKQQTGALPIRAVTKVFRDVAKGLHAIHEKGLVHRDIKPANLLIVNLDPTDLSHAKTGSSPNLSCKILDFGLAQFDDEQSDVESPKSLVGTPAYFSPEQIKNSDHVDQKSDIFSCGVSLYQAITGEKPFRGSVIQMLRKIEHDDPTPPSELNDRIPPDLESICLKSLEKDRRRRYETIKSFGKDLERFESGVPTIARPVGNFEKFWKLVKRRPKASILVGALAVSLLAVAVLSVSYATIVGAKNNEILAREEANQKLLVRTVLNSQPESLKLAISNLIAADFDAVTRLKEFQEAGDLTAQQQANIALALAEIDQVQVEEICNLIPELPATPWLCQNILSALRPKSKEACVELKKRFESTNDQSIKSRYATIMLYLNEPAPIQEILDTRGTNGDRRYDWIFSFAEWHGDWDETLKVLKTTEFDNVRTAFITALGTLRPRTIPNYEEFSDLVTDFYQRHADAATHRFVFWMLRKWEVQVPELNETVSASAKANWYLCPNGLTMVKIPAGKFLMGDTQNEEDTRSVHEVVITKPFYLASTEVTRKLWESIKADTEYLKKYELEAKQFDSYQKTSPTNDLPAQSLSWEAAIIFCNWLSEKEGLTPCYTLVQKKPKVNRKDADQNSNDKEKSDENQPNEKEAITYNKWAWDRNANGYRLASEAEWEYACRAGTTSRYYFGSMDSRANLFGRSSNRRQVPTFPPASLIPNSFGVFDMHGNVWEWCWDWHVEFDSEPKTDPIGPEEPAKESFGAARTHRGGGVANFSGDSDSDARGAAGQEERFYNVGFRIARNAE